MSRKPRTIEETLRGSVGHVPAELLVDPRVSDSAVRLYALVRALGPGSDTFRRKDSLASILGWSERKLYRVARVLELSGWLKRSSFRKGSTWVSTWSVSKVPGMPNLAGSARTGSAKPGGRGMPEMAEDGTARNGRRVPPTTIENHPGIWEGLSSSIEEKTLSVHELWGCLPSWDRDHAPAGWETLADSLVEVLDRKALPKGTTQATLALAFVDRIRSRKSLRGINSPEGVLIRAARGRDAEADEVELQELLARAPGSPPADPEPVGTESIPTGLLANLADSLAIPGTRGPLRARSRA